ncbi:beta-lactamase [Sphaeroforma arctica JP610]|uniref:Beta-lactamase n=1 Tax=Sphaeroforma arctica JP610 TaxID=667725 RepID=A0A0L0FCF7_9EUKA|nr:beta-lactamase [Sphaeroforma arctica JP610]KNC74450.1 beta-lactamase [Sphaeroforma arctica JP610]|eukprot:XP_014148352.1 beta-lactamase [Sphaeroforma arctica JP610]
MLSVRGAVLTACASIAVAQVNGTTNSSTSNCNPYVFDYEGNRYNWYDDDEVVYNGTTLLGNITNIVTAVVANSTFANYPDEYPYPPGIVITIQTAEGIFEKGYGYADAGMQTPMKTNARVEVGSNTKVFVGTLLMQAVEQGLMDVNDYMTSYIPDVAVTVVNSDKITIRHLMTHNTGLFDYGDDIIRNSLGSRQNMTESYSPEELVNSIKGRTVGFAPGNCTEFSYSNTNYVLVGLILEAVHNKSLVELMNEGILQPLNLTGTTFFEGSPDANSLDSHGYYWKYDTMTSSDAILLDTTRWNLNQGWAAGAIISTGRDMVTFARALGKGELFAKGTETFELMNGYFRTSNMALYGFSGYGYGLGESFAPDLHAHGGQTLGFRSTFVFSVDQDFQVFIAQNEAAESTAAVEANQFTTFMPSL